MQPRHRDAAAPTNTGPTVFLNRERGSLFVEDRFQATAMRASFLVASDRSAWRAAHHNAHGDVR
jgi:hypothetical protein